MAYEEKLEKAIPQDPNTRFASVVFGYDPVTKDYFPLTVVNNGDGTYKLKVEAGLEVGDIEIGAVEIKNSSSDDRVTVTSSGELLVKQNSVNMTSDYAYYSTGPGTGKIQTIKEYITGTAPGGAARLSTYTYNIDGKVEKIVESVTTV